MKERESFGDILDRHIVTIFFSKDLADDFRGHLLEYIKMLKISFFTLHFHHTIRGNSALKTDTNFLLNGSALSLTDGHTVEVDKSARDQVSAVFIAKEPHWIIGAIDDEELSIASGYRDLWNNYDLKEFPRYTKRAHCSTKTSVIIPVSPSANEEPEVIVNFEFEEVVQPTPALKQELRLLAKIALLIRFISIDAETERNSTIEAFNIIHTDSEYRGASNAILAVLLATDIVDERIFECAKQKIENRISSLEIDFYIFHESRELLIGCEVEPGYAPSKIWNKGWRDNGTEKFGNSNPVYECGEVVTQVGYVFDRLQPALISGEQSKLIESNEFKDELNDNKTVPLYVRNSIGESAVSILCPSISKEHKTFGIVNFEFNKRPETLDSIFIKGLSELARSIGRLESLYEASKIKRKQVQQSISDLRPYVVARLHFKQQIFFVYPEKLDRKILTCVENAVDALKKQNNRQLNLKSWEDAKRPGSAQTNLRQSIKESQLVIGYFSELENDKVKENVEPSYKDNTNVIAELTYYYGRDGKEVLGIREKNASGELPFILKDLQYINIKRFKENNTFSDKDLTNKIAGMIAGALSLSWSPQ